MFTPAFEVAYNTCVKHLPIFFSAGGVNAWVGVLFWNYNCYEDGGKLIV